jgi:ATP-binding cassette subfamily B protein
VEHCDRILVLDGGAVTGFDTHDQLLKTNALYKEIYDIQMADRGDFDKQKGGVA